MNGFLPISKDDLKKRGWNSLDIILVTGDAYVDHPSYCTALIGRVLEDAGFKVGVIAQPDWKKKDDFLKLGRPRLFFGVTAGNLDSMVANFTANKKLRSTDEYSPGGKPGLRPERATIVYANRIREAFPNAAIVIGGIEASLRRLAHYDYWSDKIRRSVLLDSKADILVYGMGERAVLEIARRLNEGEDIKNLDDIQGTAVVRNTPDFLKNYIAIPSFEEVSSDKDKFNEAFKKIYEAADPYRGKTVVQKHGERFVIQLPPAFPLASEELDKIYSLNYKMAPHPSYNKSGSVPGYETVKNSITSHRGCSGECSFCSLYFHQGRIIQSRSEESILDEIKKLAAGKDFKGTITDIGGPTANLYKASCRNWKSRGACSDKSCLFPEKCGNLKLGYKDTMELWKKALKIPKVKHIFIGSGVRYDLLVDDSAEEYLTALCRDHVSGRLKVAPEHTENNILKLMHKPPIELYNRFVEKFNKINKALNKNQYIVNYFVSAHPGSTLEDVFKEAEYFIKRGMAPEEVQDFIPLPMTLSAAMYYTGSDPFSGKKIYIPKGERERRLQRALIQYKIPGNKKLIYEALKKIGKINFFGSFLRNK